ncbi:Mannose-6-phosphate isomerase [Paramicrosporidium saccamoebae]|uniref:Mannose-6-phosphate isomerase n=1 Tax=Paramicrosporidium saccamoebae TaxID=1246581 RepID=A0A2H9TGQ3_9FUNG|nr:Mannose-6-phosphate isomerase [Paramicrosporidium saccamoebae]
MVVATESSVCEVVAAVQNYEWGLLGSNSLVAKISAKNSDQQIDESKPYAETTSPMVLPAILLILADLPFLFKILSVGKALSIQAHPDIELAKKLHAKDPKNYRDPNHKPEMTIALTIFEALCGFRPLAAIVENLANVPELNNLVDIETVTALKAVVKSNDSEAQKTALKNFFAKFIAADKEIVCEQINAFVSRLTSINRKTTELEELCLRLNSQYPEEVGCFCVFLLNYITLTPGEAVFLAANEPHAYLSGECIECMALSDNVVRAGLTPKFRDMETLVEMLTYKTYDPKELAMKPKQLTEKSVLYKPPVPEFAVIKTDLVLGDEEKLKTGGSEEILLCIKGELALKTGTLEQSVKTGSILLLGKKEEYALACQSSDALLFRAFAQTN